MRLTTKGRYAVTAMLDLALHEDSAAITLRNIAENQKISLSYLEQLFAKLRKQELVKGMRGPGGGYRLSRSADDISIAEIISAVDEPMQFTDCNGEENCKDGERCLSHTLWVQLTDQLENFLSNIYLGALMRESETALEQRNAANQSGSQKVNLPLH
ncbi:MAG: Rrf2 family transcriptional regulator [Arenicellales bacterium]